MNRSPEFSIIIPFKTWSKDLDECLDAISRLHPKNFEVLLVPDNPCALPTRFDQLALEIIVSGSVSPAIKRDQGAARARGKYLAFIDDDAYPEPTWLAVASEAFENSAETGAIGGPGITPKTDPFWARVSGAVFLSRLSGGFPERYLPLAPARFVDDWPSVNLIVRKPVFEAIGGFDSSYWPGEDTKLCRDIINSGWKIRYVPSLIVHHHRRPHLRKHLRQTGNYGFHRGLFARRYPENSRKLVYFTPSIFVLFLLIGAVGSLFSQTVGWLFIEGLFVYGGALIKSFGDIVRHEDILVGLLSLPYIFITHCWYGIRFLQGLSTERYQMSLGR